MTTNYSETLDPPTRAEHSSSGPQVNLFSRCGAVRAVLRGIGGRARAFVAPAAGAPEKIEVDARGVRIGSDSIEVTNRIADLGVQTGGHRSAEAALWVDDADAVYARALQVGATARRAPMVGSGGRLRVAWVLDPEGHLVKILPKRTGTPVGA